MGVSKFSHTNEKRGVSPRLDLLTPFNIHTHIKSSPIIIPTLTILPYFLLFHISSLSLYPHTHSLTSLFLSLIFVITQIYVISFILSFCITLHSFLLLIFYSDYMVAPNCLQDKSVILLLMSI